MGAGDDDALDTASERAAAVSWRIAHGWQPTTRDVATLTGLTINGAWRLMNRMQRSVPIYLDGDRRWRDLVGHD
jgi:hypothetical protein